MAETDLYKTMINNPQLPQNPNQFYTHFFYKAVFVSIFLLLLPLFPSEAPDFINHTINTRSWELLQLLFVGIAVSYGLFSKRNDEQQQQQGSVKSDNAQSYMARLLQVSSVFDDDSETLSEPNSINNSKVQTWNSQYYRGEPIVVVAKETSQQASDSTATVEKPLLLPVRSLKNGVSESSSSASMIDFKVRRSNSKRFSRNLSGVSPESEEENIVLQSPIPWRSRSGRMEIKEDFTQTPEIINPIDSPSSSRYQSSKPSSDPPSLSLSSEIQSKSLQDVGRKKIPTKSSFSPIPPPPPPPPPPPSYHPRVNLTNSQNTSDAYSRKEFRRNARSFPNKFSEDAPMAAKSKSFRTPRQQTEFDGYLLHDDEIESFLERRGSQKKFMTDDEEKKKFMEAEKDVEEESDDDDDEEEDELQELASKNDGDHDHGPDVDKKADEFIAKFREQIRLQRIASIRRSTTQTLPKIGGR